MIWRAIRLREKVVHDPDPGIADCPYNVSRWVHADDSADFLIGQRSQKHAVIAADFDHR